MSILSNPIIRGTDSYKLSHFMQYPEGTTFIKSYVEARGSKVEGCNEVVFYGVQSYIKDTLLTPITMEQVEEADLFAKAHGTPFNRPGWERIVNVHGGFLPIVIRAVPEGTVVPVGELMSYVVNTDEELPWLTSYIETDYLRAVWYGSTVATMSREIKKVIKNYLDLTSDDPDAELPFKLHDFGSRGVSSLESAAIAGSAHLVNFMGTDTIAGIGHAAKYYNAGVCGFSIPASEHSTSTLEGREGELNVYRRMVAAYAKPGAIFANVIDSYDTFNAIKMYHADGLFDAVKAAGATVVMRPDSGDPVLTPIQVILNLMDLVGYSVNSKGFKVLPSHIRVIQGDGIDIDDVKQILERLFSIGVSASNIAFGMGGGLLQKVNRDTFKFAMKACHAVIKGNNLEVYKEPAGQPDKASKRGDLELYKNKKTGQLKTYNKTDVAMEFVGDAGMAIWDPATQSALIPATVVLFESYGGNVRTNFSTFDQVRARAAL